MNSPIVIVFSSSTYFSGPGKSSESQRTFQMVAISFTGLDRNCTRDDSRFNVVMC